MKLLHKIDIMAMLYGLVFVGVNNSDFNSQECNQNLNLNRVVLLEVFFLGGGGLQNLEHLTPV